MVGSSAAFAVHSPPQLSFGWYRTTEINEIPYLVYEDNSALRIVWEKSYVYKHPGKSPLYWYLEVIYLNRGRQALPIQCISVNSAGRPKAHPDLDRHRIRTLHLVDVLRRL